MGTETFFAKSESFGFRIIVSETSFETPKPHPKPETLSETPKLFKIKFFTKYGIVERANMLVHKYLSATKRKHTYLHIR